MPPVTGPADAYASPAVWACCGRTRRRFPRRRTAVCSPLLPRGGSRPRRGHPSPISLLLRGKWLQCRPTGAHWLHALPCPVRCPALEALTRHPGTPAHPCARRGGRHGTFSSNRGTGNASACVPLVACADLGNGGGGLRTFVLHQGYPYQLASFSLLPLSYAFRIHIVLCGIHPFNAAARRNTRAAEVVLVVYLLTIFSLLLTLQLEEASVSPITVMGVARSTFVVRSPMG